MSELVKALLTFARTGHAEIGDGLIQLAQMLTSAGRPYEITYVDLSTASRAVGSAVGRNRISWLIPCHRVIHRQGRFGHYRWGAIRKRAMLGWEAARRGQ